METIKLEIRIPKHLKAYYEAFSIVEDTERDLHLLYAYIIEGGLSIEEAAKKIEATPKELIDYYKHRNMPLNNIEKYIKEEDDSRIR